MDNLRVTIDYEDENPWALDEDKALAVIHQVVGAQKVLIQGLKLSQVDRNVVIDFRLVFPETNFNKEKV